MVLVGEEAPLVAVESGNVEGHYGLGRWEGRGVEGGERVRKWEEVQEEGEVP